MRIDASALSRQNLHLLTKDGPSEYIDVGDVLVKNHNYVTNAKEDANSHPMRTIGGEYMGLHMVIGVPGWESEEKECVCGIWAKALHGILKKGSFTHPAHYAILARCTLVYEHALHVY